MKKRPPKSLKKYIRKEKARIRREVFDLEEQEKLINRLYQRFMPRSEFPTGSAVARPKKVRGIVKELASQNKI